MNRIKELRIEKGLTQNQLASLLGINQTAAGKYERGELEPNLQNLIKLSHIFECSVDYIICNADDFGNITIHTEKARPASAGRARTAFHLSSTFPGTPFSDSRICPLLRRKIRKQN